jgi:VIT1/CCC1 family predicted Fe2+/Mn2+ transporter
MGTGEYISVTNQNELVGAEVSLERRMLARFPAAEEEELAGYFRRYGADPCGARKYDSGCDQCLPLHRWVVRLRCGTRG